MAEAGAEAAGSAVDKVADAELEQRERSQGASTSGEPHTILETSDAVLQQRTYFVPTMVTQSSNCFSSIPLEHTMLQKRMQHCSFGGVLSCAATCVFNGSWPACLGVLTSLLFFLIRSVSKHPNCLQTLWLRAYA